MTDRCDEHGQVDPCRQCPPPPAPPRQGRRYMPEWFRTVVQQSREKSAKTDGVTP